MKRNKLIIFIMSLLLLVMNFNIVSFAEEDTEYINCYGNKLFFKSEYTVASKPLVVRHFANQFLFDIPSDRNFTKEDLLNDVDYLLQNADVNWVDYPYYYIKIYDLSSSSYQYNLELCVSSTNDFVGCVGWDKASDGYMNYSVDDKTIHYNRWYPICVIPGGNRDYAYFQRGNDGGHSTWESEDNSYTYNDNTINGNSNQYLLCTNMNIYNNSEIRNITNGDLVVGANYYIHYGHFEEYKSQMTLLNDSMDVDYGKSPLDTSSEGSNNAFSQFTMCGVADTKYYSNYGLALNYALSDMAYNTYSRGKLCVDYTITIRMVEQNQNNVLPVKTLKCSQKYDLRGHSGSVEVDLFTLIKSNINGSMFGNIPYYQILTALSGVSVSGVSVNKVNNPLFDALGDKFHLPSVITDFFYVEDNVTYTYVFDTFTVSAKAYVSNGSSSTNRRNASVDLVKGSNNSYNYTGVDVNNLSPDTSDVINNTNYFVNTDNGYRYYNSVTNEVKDCGDTPYVSLGDIVVNVDISGGGGSSGNMTQNNNVSFPESIFIKFQDMNKVTIADDDLTYEALQKRLKEGFGLIDDDSTPEYGDGFISMISDIYSGIDPNLKIIIMYGISTTIGIAVIRMIFKR